MIRERYTYLKSLIIQCRNEQDAKDVINVLVDDGFAWGSDVSTEKRETFWKFREVNDDGISYFVPLVGSRIYRCHSHFRPDPEDAPYGIVSATEFINGEFEIEETSDELLEFLSSFIAT